MVRPDSGFRVAQLLQKEREIVPLGESGKLGRVIQSHIYEPLDSGLSQCAEELSSFFLGKTDCVDFHSGTSSLDSKRLS